MWVITQDKRTAINLTTAQSIYTSTKKGYPSLAAHNVNGEDNWLGAFASMDDAMAELGAIMGAMQGGAAAYGILPLAERRAAQEEGQRESPAS